MQTQSPNLSSRLWGGELRDDTKNGCVADYAQSVMRQCLLFVVFQLTVVFANVFIFKLKVQSNLFNTDTKGTEPSVRFTEVSVL